MGAKTFVFVINDRPYGSERPYNALRLALDLVNRENVDVRVYLVGDGVNCASMNQKTAEEYYNLERMLKSIPRLLEEYPLPPVYQLRNLTSEFMVRRVSYPPGVWISLPAKGVFYQPQDRRQ